MEDAFGRDGDRPRAGGGDARAAARVHRVHARARHRHARPGVQRRRPRVEIAVGRGLGQALPAEDPTARSSRPPRRRAAVSDGLSWSRPTTAVSEDEVLADRRRDRRRGRCGAAAGLVVAGTDGEPPATEGDRRRTATERRRSSSSRWCDETSPAPKSSTARSATATRRRSCSPRRHADGAAGRRNGPRPGVDGRRGRRRAGRSPSTERFPFWRTLGPGVDDGKDVLQLEYVLAALGYAAEHDVTVDDEWTSATTDAVEAFQERPRPGRRRHHRPRRARRLAGPCASTPWRAWSGRRPPRQASR